MHKSHSGDSAHDLSVKLSPWLCSHNSCPDWRNDGNLLAYVIPIATSGEDIATYPLSSLAYKANIMFDYGDDKVIVCVPPLIKCTYIVDGA